MANTNTVLKPARLVSIDAYRGLVMLLMWAEVCALWSVAEARPGSSFWQAIAFHTTHVPWGWGSLHDMIQPSFTFLSGVSLPFSIASRLKRGDTKKDVILHAIKRSIILIALGILLRSIGARQTYFTFEDTLTQIGLGYTFLTLLGFASQRIQIITLVLLLAGYWLLFALWPLPPAGFDYASAGVAPDWAYNYKGFAAHWNLNTNPAAAFDKWFLNLFPREKPFLFHPGGYHTLSFIPTLGTMILGLLAGNKLKEKAPPAQTMKWFFSMGTGLLVLSIVLHLTGINPIVKRIWTPAWTLFSGGISFFFLLFFYYFNDVRGWVRWAFPLVVIGANSIFAYVIADSGLRGFISSTLHTHLGQEYDHIFGAAYASIVNGILVLLVMWLMLHWMYKNKVFIRI